MTSDTKTKSNGTNWSAARAYYLALPADLRTFAAVARRFGVSDVRVSQVARRDRWLELDAEVERQAAEVAVAVAARDRSERLRKTLQVYDGVNDQALAKLEKRELEIRVADLPPLFKMAELAAGEATDRVALSELQPVLVAFARIAVLHAPADRRGDVLRELEAASSGLVTLESAA